jgi:hypothetical protein
MFRRYGSLVLGGTALFLAVAGTLWFGPDLRRYMHIKRM